MAASLAMPPAAAVGPWVACCCVVSEQPARRKHATSRVVSEPTRPRAAGYDQPLMASPDLTRLSIVLRPGVSSVVVDSWQRSRGRDAHLRAIRVGCSRSITVTHITPITHRDAQRSARVPAPATSFHRHLSRPRAACRAADGPRSASGPPSCHPADQVQPQAYRAAPLVLYVAATAPPTFGWHARPGIIRRGHRHYRTEGTPPAEQGAATCDGQRKTTMLGDAARLLSGNGEPTVRFGPGERV
jgi:hypothetical protein